MESSRMKDTKQGMSYLSVNGNLNISISPVARLKKTCEKLRTKNIWTVEISRDLDESLKEIIKDCKVGNLSVYTDISNRDIFDNIGFILSEYLSPVEMVLVSLNSTIKNIFGLIAEAAKDPNFCDILRDNYGMLQILTDVLNPAMNTPDLEIILGCLDALTRDYVTSWKVPFLRRLIDKLYVFIQNKFDDTPRMCLVLQILVNLCSKNASCVLIAHDDPKSRTIWHVLREDWAKDRKVFGTPVDLLIGHFLYLITSNIRSDQFITGYEIIKLSFDQLIDKFNNSAVDSGNMLSSIGDMMNSIGEKMRVMFERYDLTILSHTEPEQAESISHGRAEYTDFLESLMEKLRDFVMPIDKLDGLFVKSLIHFMQSALPTFVPLKTLFNSYMGALQITEKIFMKIRSGAEYNMCLKMYLHIAEQLENTEDRQFVTQKMKDVEPYFQKTLTNIKFVGEAPAAPPPDAELVALIARLFTSLCKLPNFPGRILEKLDGNAIKGVIEKLAALKDSRQEYLLHASSSVVELLFLLSQFTKDGGPLFSTMLQLIRNPDVCSHLAKGLQSGNENIILKSLHIFGFPGFAKSNLAFVTKNLISLRTTPNVTSELPENHAALASCTGVKRVNEILRSFNALEQANNALPEEKKQKMESSMGDLIACYKLKQEMLEFELSTLNNQICQTNKSKLYISSILDKQSETVDSLLLEKEKHGMELINLQSKLDKVFTELGSVKAVHQKEIEKLSSDLDLQVKTCGEISARLETAEARKAQLEADIKETKQAKAELNAQYKKVLKETQALNKKVEETNAMLRTVQIKNTELEGELHVKNEELSDALVQLEQQKQIVNTIRSVLGQNTFGGLLSQNT